jgi:hypothetical protein
MLRSTCNGSVVCAWAIGAGTPAAIAAMTATMPMMSRMCHDVRNALFVLFTKN